MWPPPQGAGGHTKKKYIHIITIDLSGKAPKIWSYQIFGAKEKVSIKYR